MAGTRKFDTEAVLDAATRVFWKLGYEATTIDDLTRETGLGRGSLYGAFKNKETLFIAAIEHYLVARRTQIYDALDHSDLRTAINATFDVLFDLLTDHTAPAGCMMVAAANIAEEQSSSIRRRIVKAFASEEAAFFKKFDTASKAGQLADGVDPRQVARFFAVQTRTLALQARISPDPTALQELVDTTKQALDAFLKPGES